MTIQVLCEKLVYRSALAVLLLTAPLAAQDYQGTSTSVSPGPAATAQLAMNLTMNGAAISGAIGIGSTVGGATITGPLAANIPVSGTRNGQNCTVKVAGGITYTGVCTATSFAGWYQVGAQSGTFRVTAAAPAPVAAPAQVATPPVRATAPVAAAKPTVAAAAPVQQRAISPVATAPPPPAIAANGVVGWLAAPPQAQPPPPVEVPWLAATGTLAQGATPTPAQVPVTPAPVPARPPVIAPPVPVRPAIPSVAGMCGAGQQYQGTFYADTLGSIFFNLTFNGGTISGTTGSTAAGEPFLNIYPVTGTRVGTTCTVTTRGGAVFAGTCDAQNFRGTTKTTDGVKPFVTTCGGTYPPAPAPVRPTPPVPVTCPISSPTPEHYQGTMTTLDGVQEPMAFNLVTEGGNIVGTMGIGVAGRPLDTPNSITGTRVGQTCSVRTPIGAIYTGTCDGKTFNGTYSAAEGTMHFTTSLAAGLDDSTTACGAGPTPVPVPVPVPVKCPAAGAMQSYTGTISLPFGNQGSLAMAVVFNGGNISGTLGMGQVGTVAPLTSPVTGTMTGQHCHATLGGMNAGVVLDGTCDGKTFSGKWTNGALDASFALTDMTPGATAGCVAPVPPPAPVVCPATTATGTYQGAVYLPNGLQGSLSLHLVSNGGAITGLMGKGDLGTNPTPVDPMTGTRIGQHCSVTVGGANAGVVLNGTCDGQTFAGTYVGNGLNTVFAVKNMTGAAPAGCAGPTPVPTPIPGPLPNPVPFPQPTPAVVRYCGTFTNTTIPFTGAFQIVLQTPNTFAGGTLLIGPPKSPTVGSDFGGGGMSGDWGTCAGLSDQGFTFLSGAVCTATTISGNYTIPVGNNESQHGYFSSTATTAEACP